MSKDLSQFAGQLDDSRTSHSLTAYGRVVGYRPIVRNWDTRGSISDLAVIRPEFGFWLDE